MFSPLGKETQGQGKWAQGGAKERRTGSTPSTAVDDLLVKEDGDEAAACTGRIEEDGVRWRRRKKGGEAEGEQETEKAARASVGGYEGRVERGGEPEEGVRAAEQRGQVGVSERGK